MKPAEHSSGKNKVEGLRYEKTRKSFLGKSRDLILGGIIIIVVGLAAYFYLQQMNHRDRYTAIEYHNQDLEQQLVVRDSLINEWVGLFDQVQSDLNAIKEKEHLLSVSSEDLELTASEREAILSDIQMLSSLLEENKRKIAALNSRLKKSGAHISTLEKKIEELNFLVEERNRSIDSLTVTILERDEQLAVLNTRVSDMETTMGQQTAIIETQEGELNKAFVTFGSAKELKEKGIVVKEGGFLGLGRTKILNTDFPQEAFTPIDITTTMTIPVNAKDVELITEHPQGSYNLVTDENEDLIAYIEIKNPEEFWKISRYAIVETDK